MTAWSRERGRRRFAMDGPDVYKRQPLDRCAAAGIPVFSTPGANANAVKELVICAMLMGSRDIPGAIRWVREQAASGVDVSTVVEKGKDVYKRQPSERPQTGRSWPPG